MRNVEHMLYLISWRNDALVATQVYKSSEDSHWFVKVGNDMFIVIAAGVQEILAVSQYFDCHLVQSMPRAKDEVIETWPHISHNIFLISHSIC